jgi:hypothetical protein
MFYRSSSIAPSQRRPGVVLLVVMAMLALFASLALSFVFYADSQAVEAGYSVSAQTRDVPEIDPEVLMGYFLSKYIYDDTNPNSAGYGQSLARLMYGYNPGVPATASTPAVPGTLSFTPYSGAGRASLASSGTVIAPSFGGTTVDYPRLTNYQQFSAPTALPWSATTAYVPSNVVTSGGNYYVCIQAATGTPVTNTAVWQVDPLISNTVQRTPEFYGKATDPGGTYRFVGGANPPWTAYDSNSLFLAQVRADGTVLMPSFSRPWNSNGIPAGSAALRYTSPFPDQYWNPAFYPLPDADALGNQVRNLDYGPGMLSAGTYYPNDSKWMDWGFPIMTAPNGKRYKPLFASLAQDMSNRLHMWAHGNNLGGTAAVPVGPPGVSNMGLGAPEVNINYLFGIPIAPATVPGAQEAVGKGVKGRQVTITTTRAHGLVAGQQITIAGVPGTTAAGAASNGYNGVFTVLAAGLTATTFRYTDAAGVTTLQPSGGGFVYTAAALNELQLLYQFRYGAGKQAIDTVPSSVTGSAAVPGPARPGAFFSLLDLNAMNAATSMSSKPFYMPNLTVKSNTNIIMPKVVPPGGVQKTVTVNSNPLNNPPTPATPAVDTTGQFPVYFFDVVTAGSILNVGGETVTVLAAPPPNPVTGTFTANFHLSHPAGTLIVSSTPSGFPTFPAGWSNAAAGSEDLTNLPLAFNLFLPVNPNIGPLPLSQQEAMLRWGGTNSPALTSPLFQKMPLTFGDPRKRNLLTMANTYMDRSTSAPFLNYNRNSANPQYYGYSAPNGLSYPTLGKTEVQQITVTGTAGTYKLAIPGRAGTTAAIAYNASVAGPPVGPSVQGRLQTLLNGTGGGTVTVTPGPPPVPPSPTTRVYTVTFSGTLSNIDVGQMTATTAGNPAPIVTIATVQNGLTAGTPIFPAPTYGTIPSPIVANSEFNPPDMRSTLGQLLRVDLSRTLTDYPAPAAASGLIPTATAAQQAAFARAQGDRQQFAKDIYNALIRVTGARDPNVNANMQPTAPDYQAARWLAQLAVNIVDYIDNDDYSTPFNWYPGVVPAATTANPEGWVFGVELPRVVLNGAYAQLEATGQVNIWAQMYNPFKLYNPGTYPWSPLDNGTALLQLAAAATATPPYIIEIHAKDAAFMTAMQNPANPTGFAANPLSTQFNWGTAATAGANMNTQQILAGNGVQSAVVSRTIAAAPAGAVHAAKGNTVTITTTTPHGLTVADVGKPITVNVTGAGGGVYSGTFLITAPVTATKFHYTLPAAAVVPPPSGGGTIQYGGNPAGPNFDQALGFYVIGPKTAPSLYSTPGRDPNVLATYLSPVVANTAVAAGQGMSFTNTPLNIKPATAKAGTTGVSHVGTTVTVNLTAAMPATVAVGDLVVIQNVMTQPVKGGAATPAVYNNSTAGNPATWTITFINVARTSFTFTYTGAAPLPGAGTESGTITVPATVTLPTPTVTLQLRKLANPHLPAQTNPAIANFNPYITVDSFDIPAANINAAPNPAGSLGRTEPYAFASPPPIASVPFFTSVANPNYHWLVHLDRPPVNPLELLHVSGCRPHELTQKFGGNYGHYAPWNPFNTSAPADPNALIYRALDQMSTHFMAGQYAGGRFQGNINLNTVMEYEVWQALCDAHDASSLQYPNPWFTQADVARVFTSMTSARGAPVVAAANGTWISSAPTAEPTPFKSFSAASTVLTVTGATTTNGLAVVTGLSTTTGLAAGMPVTGLGIPPGTTVVSVGPGAGTVTLSAAATFTGAGTTLYFATTSGNQVSLNDSWFRQDPSTGRPVFAVGSTSNHPYLQASLLQKIYNNITPTSNVFAVWCTVGFFEVVDETVKPARLGQEIGRAQNKHIRHRFFAIIDRSGLQLYNTASTLNAAGTVTLTANQTLPQSKTLTYSVPAWVGTQNYAPGNIVSATVAGTTTGFCCITANMNQAPTSATGDANWQPMMQPGMLLEIDTGTATAEVVVVQSATGMTFTANFAKNHLPGVSIICRGNPGPKTSYNPHDDPGVVLHMSVIK